MWNRTHYVTTEGCVVVAHNRIATDLNMGVRQVYSVVVPILEDHGGQLRTIANNKLHVVGVSTGTLITDEHHCLGVRLKLDDEGAVGDLVLAGTVDGDGYRRLQCSILGNAQVIGLLGVFPSLCRCTIHGCARATETLIALLELFDSHAGGVVISHIDRDSGALASLSLPIVQAAQFTQRGEAPVLVLTVRNGEVRSRERGETVALGLVARTSLDGRDCRFGFV